eukprot:CAMPEP_0119408652 /NCGR_PEP_ID=MMETSP1335-20130426/2149_1 /TAXON_ID=259385 /ORGANISM="Chrysoculter rhomboideus, Strain RCC1486" /LENGTH=61 /DNA_ID=CAMNT_0007432925 /DNA_START=44 /DNA_END=225 /DNA_ORIENTATION=-
MWGLSRRQTHLRSHLRAQGARNEEAQRDSDSPAARTPSSQRKPLTNLRFQEAVASGLVILA